MIAVADHAEGEAQYVERDERGANHTLVLLVGSGRGANALASALRQEGLRAMVEPALDAAMDDMERWKPDVVLTGPETEPQRLEAFLRRARKISPGSVFLHLAECKDVGRATGFIDRGVDDVVCPPHSVSAIRVRTAIVRRFARSPRTEHRRSSRRMTLGHLTVDLATRQVMDGEQPFSLSGREFELLVRLMEASGQVVSRDELMEDIWGDVQGSEAVLDATVHRLRRRLEERLGEPELVITVRGVGYRLDTQAMSRASTPPPAD